MLALARIHGRITDACGAVAAVLVLALTVLVAADVILRNLTRDTIPGDIELSEYAMLFITAFSAPWLLERGQHIRIDLMLKAIPSRAAWMCEIACDAIGIALSGLLAWYGARAVVASYAAGTRMVKEFLIPEWWILLPLPLMFVLLAVGFVLRLHRVATGPRQVREEGAQV